MAFLTRQQVFDQGLFGVRRQNYVASQNKERQCAYRGLYALKCVVGHSIPGEIYKKEMDACLMAVSRLYSCFVGVLGLFRKDYLTMLGDMQHTHDYYLGDLQSPLCFEDGMRRTAALHVVTYTPPTLREQEIAKLPYEERLALFRA